MVQPPRTRDRIRVGLFAKFKDKGATAPQILGMLREFNSAHGSSLRLIRPQIAELVANPPSMFPSQSQVIAISILGQSGLTTHYPFEEGTFPTSSIIAYPGREDGLPKEVVCRGEGDATFIFKTGKFEGSRSALIVPEAMGSLVVDGPLVVFTPDEEAIMEFPYFPDTSSPFIPRHDAPEKTREAFCALGGTMDARSPKTFRRVDGEHACFVGRKGKHDDHASKTEILADTSPSDGYDCALVEVSEKDLGSFVAHAPASRE
jgi:hypothetical protein